MLTDSITLVNRSKIECKLDSYGSAFPATAADLEAFEITNGSGVADGVYIYSASLGQWIRSENMSEGPYDIGLTVFDRPRSLDVIAKHLAVRTVIIPADFEMSLASANIAATDTTVINIYRSVNNVDTQIGTLTFLADQSEGVFASTESDAIVIARGQTIKFVAPEQRDATLSNIDITISGNLLYVSL